MKANLIPIKYLPQISLEKEEAKENKIINSLAKREIHKVENSKDLIVYITRTNIYFERYKKKQKKNKK